MLALFAGDYRAIIDVWGASLCSLEHRGRPMVLPQTPGTITTDYRGVVCVPWPNRLADGNYSFQGRRFQVAINEEERATALHGLGSHRQWQVVSHTDTEVILTLQLGSDPGYPFAVRVEARYRLTRSGLQAQINATNEGSTAAPYGSCPHPYLVAGPGRVNDWALELDAAHYVQLTPDRLLPTGVVEAVEELPGFRSGRRMGSTVIDTTFTSIALHAGRCTARLTAQDGHGVLMRWGPGARWVQVYTGDHVPGSPRSGLAVEPMSAPPDAFNSEEDLFVLPPGGEHSLAWALEAF